MHIFKCNILSLPEINNGLFHFGWDGNKRRKGTCYMTEKKIKKEIEDREEVCFTDMEGKLVMLFSISTLVGYLKPNLVYTYIYLQFLTE